MELSAIVGRLMAMELDDVEGVVVGDATDCLDILVDEDAYTPAAGGQIGRTLGHIATGPGPEDEAHQVDAQGFDLADVLRITHTTNLYHLYHLTI